MTLVFQVQIFKLLQHQVDDLVEDVLHKLENQEDQVVVEDNVKLVELQ